LPAEEPYSNFNAMQSGKSLLLLRKLKGLSQQEVADRLAITQQAYSKIEKKEWIDYEKVDVILTALKSSREELESIKKLIP
jgi:transcriptional regulator with XRE-family HTH domain